jgi:hypothetical protein
MRQEETICINIRTMTHCLGTVYVEFFKYYLHKLVLQEVPIQ